MKKILSTLIVVLALNSCADKTTAEEKIIPEETTEAVEKQNCADFKTGIYTYSDPSNNEVKVIRSDSTQAELFIKEGVALHSSIQWIDDCTYVLTIIGALNIEGKDIIGKTAEVEIIDVQSDKLTVVTKSDEGNVQLEMTKVQ